MAVFRLMVAQPLYGRENTSFCATRVRQALWKPFRSFIARVLATQLPQRGTMRRSQGALSAGGQVSVRSESDVLVWDTDLLLSVEASKRSKPYGSACATSPRPARRRTRVLHVTCLRVCLVRVRLHSVRDRTRQVSVSIEYLKYLALRFCQDATVDTPVSNVE